jgi:hypothetical protein
MTTPATQAEQGGILEAGRAATAGGGIALGRARHQNDGVVVRLQLGHVECALRAFCLEIGDQLADRALDRW